MEKRHSTSGDRSPASFSNFFSRPRICFKTTGRFSLATGRFLLHLHTKCEPILQQDPTLTRADRLVGQVLGEVGSLPEVFVELEVNFFLLRRLLGVRTKGSEKQGKVSKLAKGEILMLNIGSMSTGAKVIAVRNDLAKLQLTSPVFHQQRRENCAQSAS